MLIVAYCVLSVILLSFIYNLRYLLNATPTYPAVPRLSFATRFAHIFAHIFATGNEFQKYFSARRNSFDLTQNSVKSVLTWVRAWEMSL